MPDKHTAIPCTGSTVDQTVSTIHVQLGATKHLTRPLTPISFSLSYLVGGLTLSLTNNTGSRVSTERGTPDWPVRSRELGKQDGPQGEDTCEREDEKEEEPQGQREGHSYQRRT